MVSVDDSDDDDILEVLDGKMIGGSRDDDRGASGTSIISFCSSTNNKKKRAWDNKEQCIEDMHRRVVSKLYERYHSARDVTKVAVGDDEKKVKIGILCSLKNSIDKMEKDKKNGNYVSTIRRNCRKDENEMKKIGCSQLNNYTLST